MSGPAQWVVAAGQSFTQLVSTVIKTVTLNKAENDTTVATSSQSVQAESAVQGGGRRDADIDLPGTELLSISVWLAGADPQVEALIADKLAAYFVSHEDFEADV